MQHMPLLRARRLSAISTLVAGLLVLAAVPSAAQQKKSVTGIDSIHDQMRSGGKVCMASHEHYGEGTMPSRHGAEAAAIRHWQIFTADEYGTAWGQYTLAASKKVDCKQSGGAWTCQITARPCRTGR